jgi:hypothetical protein
MENSRRKNLCLVDYRINAFRIDVLPRLTYVASNVWLPSCASKAHTPSGLSLLALVIQERCTVFSCVMVTSQPSTIQVCTLDLATSGDGVVVNWSVGECLRSVGNLILALQKKQQERQRKREREGERGREREREGERGRDRAWAVIEHVIVSC